MEIGKQRKYVNVFRKMCLATVLCNIILQVKI